MREVSSFWVLQEVFVDPGVAGDCFECSLNLEVKTSLKKLKNWRAVFEITGSLRSEENQIAHLHFVNVTELESKRKPSGTQTKKLAERKVNELLSFLPLYLVKSGITVKELHCEL